MELNHNLNKFMFNLIKLKVVEEGPAVARKPVLSLTWWEFGADAILGT